MGNINIAIEQVKRIALDNRYGYSQPRRNWDLEDDCSTGSLDALRAAGYDTGDATYTGDALLPLLAAGFQNVANTVNLRTGEGLQAGDVLLRPKTKARNGHMAIMITADLLVQFQGDLDGKPGDSSGREIRIQEYYDSPFPYVLRDPTIAAPEPAPAAGLAHRLGEDVIFFTCYRSSVAPIPEAIQARDMKTNHGVITKIYAGARNPYLLNGDMCFVNDGDIHGNYAPATPPPQTPTAAAPDGFKVRITAGTVNIRSGPGKNYRDVGDVNAGEFYTIVETAGGWGRLKSGAGWIYLTGYTKRV